MRRIEETRRAFGHYHHAQYDVACILARFGEVDEAVRWLRDAACSGYPCGTFFERDPLLQPLAGHPGFAALLRDLAAEREVYGRLYSGFLASRRETDPGA